MTGNIFINYRREESGHVAGRLHDSLAPTFGRNKLFMDVDSIPVGRDFEEYLKSQVAACDAMLAIIGPNWLAAKDETGKRRLDNPDDFIVIEIGTALTREIPVVPVLVDGARMPKASELPDSLKPLARRQAIQVRHTNFSSDAEALVKRLREAIGYEAPAYRRRVRVLIGVTAMVLLLIGVGGYVTFRHLVDQSVERAIAGPDGAYKRFFEAAADADAKRKAEEEHQAAAEAEVKRLREQAEQQQRLAASRAAAEEEAKRIEQEAEQQRLAKAEEERQAQRAQEAKAEAEAEAKRKADALKAEQKRRAKTAPDTPREEIVIHSRSPFSGAKIANLSRALADELQVRNAEEGVVVVDVDNGSYASSLGFLRGDVIQEVNGEHITRTLDLERISNTQNRTWRIVIVRKGQRISVVFSR
jgi:hypothetical protein